MRRPALLTVTTSQPTGAGFDLLLLCHVACALLGLGTVAITGVQALRLLAAAPGAEPAPALRRYFTPGTNWAARVVYGVPVFGFALLASARGAYGLEDGWVMSGLGLWIVFIGLGEGMLWPMERRIQDMVARGGGQEALYPACRRACITSGVMVAILITAFVIMLVRP